MPVRSLRSPLLSWPDREAAEAALLAWSDGLRLTRPDLVRVGYFGSYARGDWGVGSDLDVVLILSACAEPPLRRTLAFDTVRGFPVPVDLLVYTAEEWQRLEDAGAPFARRISSEMVWVS
jgi:predicted nucleotidyltransferase